MQACPVPADTDVTIEKMRIRATLLPACAFFAALLCLACRSEPVAWQWPLQGQCYAAPLVEASEVYVVTQAGEVVAGDSRTGKQLWRKQFPGQSFVAAAACNGKSLFVASQQGSVLSLDRMTGKELWRQSLVEDSFEAPLTVARDLLLVPSAGGTVYCLAQSDGSTVWSHPGNLKYNTRAAVQDDRVYVGGWSNNFFCLTLDGGKPLWRFSPGRGAIVRDAVVEGNFVYFPSRDGHVYALQTSTGRLLWRFPAMDASNLVLADHRIVFVDVTGRLVSLDAQTGTPVRQWETTKALFPIYPCGSDFLGVADRIFRIDMKKERLEPIETPLATSVLLLSLAPDRLIVVHRGKSVFALYPPKKVTWLMTKTVAG